jgi:dipeptidyl aminopeptidase/acylaminoacyl peptidase
MVKRIVRSALLATVWCISGVVPASPQVQEPAWYLEIATSSGTFLVSEDGTDRHMKEDSMSFNAWRNVSPNGRFILYVDATEGDAEIFRRNLTTQTIVKLTDNTAVDNNPVWSPDGSQIAFSSNRSGQWQVYVMDNDGSNVTKITEAAAGAWKPQFSTTGQLAYLRMVTEPGKEQLVDVVILVTGNERIFLAKRRITDFAWSPNGRLLAIGELADEGGKIHFVDWTTGEDNEIDLKSKVDERLYWHSAFQIHWRPDAGAIACRLPFTGSRTVGADKIFGDEEIFVIMLDGLASWFEFDEGGFQIVGWEKASR